MKKKAKKLSLKTLTVADLSFVSGGVTGEKGAKEMECKTTDTKQCPAPKPV